MSSKSIELSAAELHEVAGRILSLREKATEHAVQIGHELLRVKSSLPHGVFVKWVENECKFKIRTAQDLMKLAREAASNATVAALMVPSTLRVYLCKSTPKAVRESVQKRLENGEHVSRSDLQSAILQERTKYSTPNSSVTAPLFCGIAVPDLLSVAEVGIDSEMSRSKVIADLIIRRLTDADYEYIMDGLNWGIWNRVLVWLRSEKINTATAVKPTKPSKVIKPPVALAP